MKVEILQRGGTHVAHDVIKHAVSFYASKLLSSTRTERMTVRVEFRKTTLINTIWGDCRPKGFNRFIIRVQRDIALEQILLVLAHEMTHVKQFALGELRAIPQCEFRNGKPTVVSIKRSWKGEVIDLPYHELPWEIEANENELPFAHEFINLGYEHKARIRQVRIKHIAFLKSALGSPKIRELNF